MDTKMNSKVNVNLDHHIPSEALMTSGEIEQIPKSEEAQLHQKSHLELRDFFDDEAGLSIWDRLRKPEFQRPTNHWDDNKCINLLQTLRGNQVIPGVIFWLNTLTGHIFVLDGAHRLSVIRAWLMDDWGDSKQALEYGYIEEDELSASKRIRGIIKEQIGSYKECLTARKAFKKAVDGRQNPADVLPIDTESKGRFAYNLNTSLRIPIQWVTGDYEIAEQSFININMGGTPLSPEEATYLNNRRSPVARAMAGIISNGRKEFLWIDGKDRCNEISKGLYTLLLSPSDNLSTKIKITEYPLCILKKQLSFDRYEFLQNLFTVVNHGQTGGNNINKTLEKYAEEKDNTVVAVETQNQLEKLNGLLTQILGNKPQSLGICPAFYFYTSKGQFRQMLFLLFLMWFTKESDEDVKQLKLTLSLNRDVFEEVWMLCKDYIFRSLSRKGAGPARLSKNHVDVLDQLLDYVVQGRKDKLSAVDIAINYMQNSNHVDKKILKDFLADINTDNGTPFKHFSKGTKVQQEMYSYFSSCYRCEICGGTIDFGSYQLDHKKARAKGGSNAVKNSRIVHPWCNNNRTKIEGLIENKKTLINANFISENLIEISPDDTKSEQINMFNLIDKEL
ncbi:MAG TPA: DUF262 domain-containing protein [Clostridia bacterium]|nr:DUF262 domain-containing protein [Clostridia bacterium]